MTDEILEHLGKVGPKAQKASRRDLPIILAQKRVGATTVASTMVLARAAGIPVFVTGGIGGVHRGAEQCKYMLTITVKKREETNHLDE